MIVFLTLIYVAILFLAVKLRIVKLNAFWKISPVLWMVGLFFVLFVPMQWGAPSGSLRIFQGVVEVVPNVTGEVVDVPVRPLEPQKEGDVLFTLDPPQYEAKVAQLEAQLELSTANLARAEDLMERRVGRQVDVDIYAAEVSSLEAQLDNARWELAETVVRAPSDGQVVALSLRPGQRVANIPLRSWIAFVEDGEKRMAVGISQTRLRHVRPGQEAEIVLRLHPGMTLKARVAGIGQFNPDSQLQPSGILPLAPLPNDPALPFFVVLELDDDRLDIDDLPGGAMGTAAIYTDSVAATHVIRRVMLRMEAWMNYLRP